MNHPHKIMKHYLLVLIFAALAAVLAGCASDNPSSGGSIAPSGSSNGSIGASQ